MPELPEVETIVSDLKRKVLKRTFLTAWTDNEKMIKSFGGFKLFEKTIKGKRIEDIYRRGKNIIFILSGGKILLIHQKMTGHMLYGNWIQKESGWASEEKSMQDPVNSFIHLIFFLDNGKMLALSDLRKFAKAEIWDEKGFLESSGLFKMGPEPLDEKFQLADFRKAILKRKGKIKPVLMDQEIIAGIGNIYADEILWFSKIHPLHEVRSLSEEQIKQLYTFTKSVLLKAIQVRGTSISDFRDIDGKAGHYSEIRKVYRKDDEKCERCGNIIKRIVVGQRGTCFCPNCQKI